MNVMFENRDLVGYICSYLTVPELYSSCPVSQLWNKAISENTAVWAGSYDKEGIPLVGGEWRDRKKDLKDIYPMTISGRMTDQYLGKMIGKIPPIHSSFMEILDMQDPLDSRNTLRMNYQFIVVPHAIKSAASEEEKIFSYKTLLSLAKDSKDGMEFEVINEIYNNKEPFSEKVSVYFIRKRVSSVTIQKEFEDQEKRFQNKGLEITPGLVRTFVMYMAARKSKEAYKQFAGSYAVTPEKFHVWAGGLFSGDWTDCHLAIGLSSLGLEILRDSQVRNLGAAAGISAEVEPTALLTCLKQTLKSKGVT